MTPVVHVEKPNNIASLLTVRFFIAFSQPTHTVSSLLLIYDLLICRTEFFLVLMLKPTVRLQSASLLSPSLSPPPKYLASLQPVSLLARTSGIDYLEQ